MSKKVFGVTPIDYHLKCSPSAQLVAAEIGRIVGSDDSCAISRPPTSSDALPVCFRENRRSGEDDPVLTLRVATDCGNKTPAARSPFLRTQ